MLTGTNPTPAVTPIANIEIHEEETKNLPLTTEQIVTEYFKDDPILVKVAFCESTLTHYKEDGTVLRGKVDNRDVGVMQINTYYHGDTADRMGLDLLTLEGNLAYAKNLYDRQGLQPWSASSKCWSKHMHLASNS